MEGNINDNKIDEFWNWFFENCQNFGEKFENRFLLAELDARIAGLGNFSWEVGPGKVEENALVISPNGDLQMLQFTKVIVAKAKQCKGWEYYYAKPPKKWDLMFVYEAIDGRKVNIDASQWEYVLLRYEDETFGILIKPLLLTELNDEDKLIIAEIVLDGVIGEEVRIQLISYIDVINEFEQENKRGISSIKVLADHLSSLQH